MEFLRLKTMYPWNMIFFQFLRRNNSSSSANVSVAPRAAQEAIAKQTTSSVVTDDQFRAALQVIFDSLKHDHLFFFLMLIVLEF